MRRTDEPLALLLGGGITALGALRNLGRRGVQSYVIGEPPNSYVRASRWYRSAPGINCEPAAAADLPATLASLPLARAVLIPCADDWQLAVAGLPPTLTDRFPSSGPTIDATRVLIDKEKFAEVLGQLDVSHPRTIPAHLEAGLPDLEDSFFADVILKPRNSKAFQARFGTKGYRCHSRSELELHAAEIRDAGLRMVLQEYIPGPATSHYFIDGFIDRSGRTSARFARQRLRMYPPDLGNSTLMVSVPLSTVKQAADDLDRLLASLRYRGTFSAEFKRDERDGIYKLLEVNCRQWWYVGFAAACGVNITWMTHQDALGIPVPFIDQYRIGVRCVHPHHDRYVCARMHREKRLSLWSWAESWLRSKQSILAWDDPLSSLASLNGLARRLRRGGDKTRERYSDESTAVNPEPDATPPS